MATMTRDRDDAAPEIESGLKEDLDDDVSRDHDGRTTTMDRFLDKLTSFGEPVEAPIAATGNVVAKPVDEDLGALKEDVNGLKTNVKELHNNVSEIKGHIDTMTKIPPTAPTPVADEGDDGWDDWGPPVPVTTDTADATPPQ